MKTRTSFRYLAGLLFANFLCSGEVRAQIIKGVEDAPPPRVVPRRPNRAPKPEAAAPTAAETAVAVKTPPAAEKPAEKPTDKIDHKVDYFARIMVRNTTYGSSLLSGNNPSAAVGTAAPNKDTVYNDFRARRLFFGINGRIEKVWTYTLIINTTQLIGNGTANTENGVATVASGVQEAHLGWAPSPAFVFRVGSMKTPFARDNLTPAAGVTTVERSLGSLYMGRLFDLGAQINGKIFDARLSYGLGIFNGNGGYTNGVNSDLGGANMAGARLQFDPLGEYKNGEASLSDKFLLSFGIAGAYEKSRAGANLGSPLPVSVTSDISSATADIGFNWGRFNLEVAYMTAFSTRNGLPFGSVQAYYATAAFWLMAGVLQAVVRYESYLNATAAVPQSQVTVFNSAQTIIEQRNVAAEDLREKRFISLGFNIVFIEKAKLRLQAFYHYGLNRYYSTRTDSDAAGGSTRITNAGESFGYADDWFVLQAQINI
jgi:Phosphate-selective porin O and P